MMDEMPTRICDSDISEDEILFIADIESFTEQNKNELSRQVKEKKAKLVVFLGDILSFLSVESQYYKIFQNAVTVFKMFYDYEKILEDDGADPDEIYHYAERIIGNKISEQIELEHKEEVSNFLDFLRSCRKKKIEVLYYAGNHDSMMCYHIYWFNRDNIPLLEKIYKTKSLHIEPSLRPVYLNKDLTLLGVHTDKDDPEGPKHYDDLKRITNSLQQIEHPEKVIFVSHIPGNSKYSKLGSQDITNFKKRFKFKFHYHGHCKNYYDEYVEEGVPTKSVHWDFEEPVE